MTRKWVLLIAMTLVTVVTWTIIEIVGEFKKEETSLEYRSYLTPIDSSFDEKALQDVLEKEREYLLVDRDILK